MIHRYTVLVASTLFLGTIAVYIATLAPSIVFADTGELALAAATGGVAHPPGFPLYLILAGLFSHLPLGSDIAYRLNFFSALAGALTVPVIYLTLRMALAAVGSVRKEASPAEPGAIGHVAPITAALLFGFSLTFWRQATITEVYTLNLLLTTLLLLFGVAHLRLAREKRESPWVLACLGLAAGLGAANHSTLLFSVPGVALCVILAPRRRSLGLGRMVLISAGVAVAAGLLAYAVLPIRAGADPLFNWGDPDSRDRFVRHVTAWQFRVNFRPGWETILRQLPVFIRTGGSEVGLVPLLLIPLGIFHLARRDRRLLAALGLCFCLPFAWSLCYDIAEDQETYYLIPFLVLAIVAGFGAALCLEEGARLGKDGRRIRVALAAALLLLGASPLPVNFARADRSRQTEARAYGLDLLETVEPDAVVFTRNWNLYAPTLYLQHLEGARRDVDVVDLNLLVYSWYLPYLEKAAPRVLLGLENRVVPFRALQARWERGDLPQPEGHARVDRLYQRLIAGMLTGAWAANRPVYATRKLLLESLPDSLEKCGVEFKAIPETLAYRILPEMELLGLKDLPFRNRWEEESTDPLAAKAREDYLLLWVNRGNYFEAYDRLQEALTAFRRAEVVSPASGIVREALERLRAKGAEDPGR